MTDEAYANNDQFSKHNQEKNAIQTTIIQGLRHGFIVFRTVNRHAVTSLTSLLGIIKLN